MSNLDTSPVYLTTAQLRHRFGDISDMTIWRWLADAQLRFPQPIYINRRRFWRIDEIERWEASQKQEAA